jgi:hypothetical protein
VGSGEGQLVITGDTDTVRTSHSIDLALSLDHPLAYLTLLGGRRAAGPPGLG